jgi:hypothetical protein
VLAPAGEIIAVLSGRQVYTQRQILPRGADRNSPKMLASLGLDYMIAPASFYRRKDAAIERLIANRIIRPVTVIAQTKGGMQLATIKVGVPVGDWRQIPKRPPKKPVRARPPKSVLRSASTTRHSSP